MNRRGAKRPLSCEAPFATETFRVVSLSPGGNTGNADEKAPLLRNRHQDPQYRKNPPQRRHRHHQDGPRHPSDRYCGCRRWNGSSTTLRLAGVVGIQVLGFITCPCRGFTPPGLGAGTVILPNGQRTALGDLECHASHVWAGGSSSSNSNSGNRVVAGLSSVATAAAGAGVHGGTRDSRLSGGGTGGDSGGGGSGGRSRGRDSATVCRALRLPSAEEGPRLGLLYDRALLDAGRTQGVDTGRSNNSPNGGTSASGATSGANASSGGCGGTAVAATASAIGAGRGSEDSSAATAAAAATVVDTSRVESLCLPTEKHNINLAQNATTSQWTSVVNGGATTATDGQTAAVDEVKAAPPTAVRRKKWSGKGWLVANAEQEGRQSPDQRGTKFSSPASSTAAAPEVGVVSMTIGTEASVPPEAGLVETDREAGFDAGVSKVNGFAASTVVAEMDRSSSPSIRSDSSGKVVVAATANATGAPAVASGLVSVARDGESGESTTQVLVTAGSAGSDFTGLQPPERSLGSELEKGDVCTTAKEELTIYLLEMGATYELAAAATAALFAAEPRCSLTEGTWKRWRQNLDGLRSTGFTGSDVANMLPLCPQLLALDFEGQVVPTMELLREQLGMRPTDMRRIIRKAPEVLTPSADGSTAKEAVDVLRALGLQTRHLKFEAQRWPQLLAVPPESFFQLAAFLASEEVGIKATNIGSLIRQAPWLVLQPIDGQMLPVARFLRIAGVTDVERVVRAYPKVLCASIKGELAPTVRFLWSDVGVSEEDLPRVLQTFPLLFALPLSRMQDVMQFLSEDLTINRKDTAKILRAFPSLLGLERERHMEGVVRYLRQLGVQNVGRFVSRLPPVLGYDVETNLAPKMDYLVEKMGLSVYDVLTFPAYFSYPLDTVIEPRTEFLNIRGRPITLVGLNIALHQGDADFARKVAKVQPRVYREFKEAYEKNRAAVKSGSADAESLLSAPQRKAIGNLGGQSTSNNVSEVTARATGLPPNKQQQRQKQAEEDSQD